MWGFEEFKKVLEGSLRFSKAVEAFKILENILSVQGYDLRLSN